jgi:hypothetical protein
MRVCTGSCTACVACMGVEGSRTGSRTACVACMGVEGSQSKCAALSPPPPCAGVKNLKLDARMRIELAEPLSAPPFFSAVVLSFLEPLEPSFSLKLETALLSEGLTAPIVKPILESILRNNVFAVCSPRAPRMCRMHASVLHNTMPALRCARASVQRDCARGTHVLHACGRRAGSLCVAKPTGAAKQWGAPCREGAPSPPAATAEGPSCGHCSPCSRPAPGTWPRAASCGGVPC